MSKIQLFNQDCITGMEEAIEPESVHLTVTSIPCPHCGNKFAPKSKLQKYCSKPCKWTANNKNRVLKPNQIFDCVVCGNYVERYVEPSKIEKGLAVNKFCSRGCAWKSKCGENHPLWKGGRILEADGYVMLRALEHPNVNNKGYVFEHRLVMETHLGRLLDRKEVVHHKNGNRSDNQIENLELFANNALHKKAEMAQTVRNKKGQIVEVNHCG